ncbi:MAG TPA: lipoate--protein ligase family protein [candidate division Zixibacteria bacterium]|nr:lipoate--protein ligase family protein [candidate division Zixibacteria bacterium]
MEKETWRVEFAGKNPGEINMQRDAIFLNDARSPEFVPILRFYDWLNPTLTIGYGQPRDDIDFDALRADGVDFAVRPTGGRAVLHWDEVTYSIILPANHPISESSVIESYKIISEGLVAGLRRLDIPAEVTRGELGGHKNPSCFSSTSRYEVVVGGRKLIGSAQRRKHGALLQQGSIPVGPQFRQLNKYLEGHPEDVGLAKKATCIREIIPEDYPNDMIYKALAEGLSQTLDVSLRITDG